MSERSTVSVFPFRAHWEIFVVIIVPFFTFKKKGTILGSLFVPQVNFSNFLLVYVDITLTEKKKISCSSLQFPILVLVSRHVQTR